MDVTIFCEYFWSNFSTGLIYLIISGLFSWKSSFLKNKKNSIFQPPAVPTKKPLVFPHSGKNTKYYQYYSLNDSNESTPPPPPVEGTTYFEYHSQLLLLSSLKRQLEDLKGIYLFLKIRTYSSLSNKQGVGNKCAGGTFDWNF